MIIILLLLSNSPSKITTTSYSINYFKKETRSPKKMSDQQQQQKKRACSFQVNEYYAQISELVPGLYISGVTGLMATGNFKAFRIQLIVNATAEVPTLKHPELVDIPRMKLWVHDTLEQDLFPHFDIVADQVGKRGYF